MLLFIGLSNLLANIIPLTTAFWTASLLILIWGAVTAWRSSTRPWLNTVDLRAWPALLVLLGLTLLFAYIQRGLMIFDEYLHVPLVSTMAAGDIPPHFYLNPNFYYAYHYALHILAASLVRLAGFFPWSGWDLSKAVTIAFTLVLGWFWIRRLTRSNTAASLGSLLIVFGGGARWLLLLLPYSFLLRIREAVKLTNTGADTASNLITALASPWVIEASPSVPFPFAFHNGIFVPVMFYLGGSGALPYMTVLLLLLLLPRERFSPSNLLAWSIIFATLALSAEHFFAFIWAGILLTIMISLVIRRLQHKTFPKETLINWGIILFISAILALVQGGFITETMRIQLSSLLPSSLSGFQAESYHVFGFSFRWPPGLPSAHLGELSLLSPWTGIALLAELGPVLLLVPIVAWYTLKRYKRISWLHVGLIAGAFLSLLFPILIKYGVDRSSTRMPSTALWSFILIGFPITWFIYQKAKPLTRALLATGYGIAVFGGIVIFAIQLLTIQTTQLTYYVNDLDAAFCQDFWDRLPENAQVIDPIASRSVALFGRITRAHEGTYVPLEDWESLIMDPNPVSIAQAGYSHIYFDEEWWRRRTLHQKESFERSCVDVMGEKHDYLGDYRILMDIHACRNE
jgi:hypothetical protein